MKKIPNSFDRYIKFPRLEQANINNFVIFFVYEIFTSQGIFTPTPYSWQMVEHVTKTDKIKQFC